MTVGKKVLIVGFGLAGMSAAISLHAKGWKPVIVERAPGRRRGGYFVGFFPAGKKAARALGVYDNFHFRSPQGSETWDIRPNGDRLLSPGFLDQPADREQGGIEGALRGDLEEGLWEAAKDICDIRFNTVPLEIDDRGSFVEVRLRDTASGMETSECFDLVIGADGVRSTVRDLVFGPREKFVRPMNSMICAFEMDAPIPTLDEHDGLMICDVDRAVWVFPLADKPPTVLLTWRTDDVESQFSRNRAELLREVYAGSPHRRILDTVFEQLERTGECIFDSVNKVEMNTWSKGRVVMLGDAAWCLTLYSGMGATSALKGAVELADAISDSPDDLRRALRSWESTMRPFIRRHRLATLMKAEVFVPSSRIRGKLRHHLMRWGMRALLKKRSKEGARKLLDQPGFVQSYAGHAKAGS